MVKVDYVINGVNGVDMYLIDMNISYPEWFFYMSRNRRLINIDGKKRASKPILDFLKKSNLDINNIVL